MKKISVEIQELERTLCGAEHKPAFTQKSLDHLAETDEEAYREIIFALADDAKNFSTTNDRVKPFIAKTLKYRGLSEGMFLRRHKDGVSEAAWLVQKMIGEFLTDGKARD